MNAPLTHAHHAHHALHARHRRAGHPFPQLSPALRGILLGLLAAVIWGSYMAYSRAGLSVGLHGSDIALIRYGTAGLIMLPWFLRHPLRKPGGIGWRPALLSALLIGPVFVLLGVGGYAFAPLAHGAVIQPGTLTVAALVLAMLVLRDRPDAVRIAGTLVIVAGLAVIAGPGIFVASAQTPVGDAMFAIAGLMWATFAILQRRWGLPPVETTAAVSVISAVIYVPVYFAVFGWSHITSVPLAPLATQILIQGVLSGVVAVIAFSRAVELLGAGRAAVFPALVPAVGILIGIPVTGELPTGLQLVGLLLVSVGLLLAMGILRWRRPQ